MTRARLVLFDLDGTLLDEQGLPQAMRRACTAVASRAGVDADALVAANTAEWQALWPDVEEDWMLRADRGAAITEDAWRGTLRRCGLDDPDLLRFALTAWATEEATAHRVFDDVPGALAALEHAGIGVGLVTNGAGVVQRSKLDAVGLLDRFSPLVISSEAGERKPSPAIFEIALTAAGVRPEEARYVGDHLWHDVAGAQSAGITGIWIDRDGHELQPDHPKPDLVLRTLADLPAAVLG